MIIKRNKAGIGAFQALLGFLLCEYKGVSFYSITILGVGVKRGREDLGGFLKNREELVRLDPQMGLLDHSNPRMADFANGTATQQCAAPLTKTGSPDNLQAAIQ